MPSPRKPAGIRKRALNACQRCRQQKIKCIGPLPCEQCTKRNLTCKFDDKSQKVLVSKEFISGLEERIAALEQPQDDYEETTDSDGGNQLEINGADAAQQVQNELARPADGQQTVPGSPSPSLERQLTNPCALGASTYVFDPQGRPIYLGTSSNWSFGRRVLSLTHESLYGAPLSPDDLLFQGVAYNLGWDGQRAPATSSHSGSSFGNLPSPDFAMYLINAVKFHCGQLFHLLDEESFMQSFSEFHSPDTDKSHLYPLWYVHYLLILAFGKVFVARSNPGKQPPGSEYFVQAMQLLPDYSFTTTDPLEATEIMCCAALYFHSLDYRSAAYRLIGQALRLALEHGMHTDMKSQDIPEAYVQRCRKIWWTVFLLDRQMSTLMGVPLGIRDEDVSAELPSIPESTQKASALSLNIRLSGIIAQIFNSVYGREGGLDQRFVHNTKTVLRSVADATDQLNSCFSLSVNGPMAGISRVSAYLHLLHHQCIILATRPILLRFLEMRLGSRETPLKYPRVSRKVRPLLQTCIDSAQQSLKVLAALQDQGLLESFLPFDLDSTSTCATVLLMAAVIDASLLEEHRPWTNRAYAIMEEMSSRGNRIAAYLKSELQQVDSNLYDIFSGARQHSSMPQNLRSGMHNMDPEAMGPSNIPTGEGRPFMTGDHSAYQNITFDDQFWQEALTTDHLMNLADSLDLEAVNWLSPSLFSVQS